MAVITYRLGLARSRPTFVTRRNTHFTGSGTFWQHFVESSLIHAILTKIEPLDWAGSPHEGKFRKSFKIFVARDVRTRDRDGEEVLRVRPDQLCAGLNPIGGVYVVTKSARPKSVAAAPPSSATKTSRTWLSAAPTTVSAGPRLRAESTDEPVIGISKICTGTSEGPMAKLAVVALASLHVTPKNTRTKSDVTTTSARKAPPAPTWIQLDYLLSSAPKPEVVR